MEAQAFLDRTKKLTRQPIFVLYGDEDFLKRRCRESILTALLGNDDPEFAVAFYAGDKLDFSTVRNELDTLPFLSSVRILVIDNAETFVTEHRAALEKYITAPSQVGVLILDVKTFPETTKLAKALPDNAKIACKAPSIYKLHELESWAMAWSQSQHGKKLTHDAAHELVERIGPAMGLIDAELEKLATSIGTRTSISPDDVEKYVGRSRGADVFQILNAVGDGQPGRAFEILGQLLNDNEEPIAILGALTHSLRKLAAVGELIALGHSLGPAMDQANVPKWPKARQEFEKQLRHLGRNRLLQLLDWLIEINMGLKGSNPLPPRLQLEMLLAKLARPTK